MVVETLHSDICRLTSWHYGYSVGLAIKKSQVRLLLGHCWRNNLRQVVQTLVPLSPSSISWYR